MNTRLKKLEAMLENGVTREALRRQVKKASACRELIRHQGAGHDWENSILCRLVAIAHENLSLKYPPLAPTYSEPFRACFL